MQSRLEFMLTLVIISSFFILATIKKLTTASLHTKVHRCGLEKRVSERENFKEISIISS